ncbi:DegT/DnrJ/EryC1/StrS aminotransferase family protein [Sanguibacter hominis ATCC BAA-789]|uniref:DegT/DnrJ/EryC1/StrS aminotransferase family protein n=1 Tax=Sanguibacter hominis ATCC BAA-789 TaxID=1312740 RepID=A0A9X5FB83_9MICO|nr:DegT/DnrJ/EryC1/StrS family aminotransferase [Sanguibacter hominis]NKX93251.1 DegT/DnrJ/EryC1/StrS aminotransferase family protein [Sanguibacter hominis ATCC BAA-789]
MTEHTAVTRELARRTGTDASDWFLVFKARYGMQVVLRELARVRGTGDVVTQVLTCATAVDPIIAAGLTPVYADIDAATAAIAPAALTTGSSTRAVVLQHTFGIVDQATSLGLRAAADSAGAILLEDAAHCVGRVAVGDDGAPVADVSVHSFGIEKMLPTRFGGAVWVSPRLEPGLRDEIVAALGALEPIGRRLDLVTRTYRTQNRVLNRLPGAVSRPLRCGLVKAGLLEPAIAPVEQRGGLPHAPAAPSPYIVAQAAAALPHLAEQEQVRAAAVGVYVEGLSDVVDVPGGTRSGQPLVRMPFLAADETAAERLVEGLAQRGVYAGRWYRPALFPGALDAAAYGYVPGDPRLAVSEDLVARLVNLPTNVSVERAREIVGHVRELLGR